jgi:hypothetical protein
VTADVRIPLYILHGTINICLSEGLSVIVRGGDRSGAKGLKPQIFEMGAQVFIMSPNKYGRDPQTLDEGLTHELAQKPPSFKGDNNLAC